MKNRVFPEMYFFEKDRAQNSHISKNNFRSFKPHSHDFYEFEYFLEGCGVCEINGKFISRSTQLLTVAKYFNWQNPKIKAEIRDCDDGVEIAVSGDAFAKGVYIDFEEYDCVLTDNFFDLTNKEVYVVKAKKSLKVMSVYDIGR